MNIAIANLCDLCEICKIFHSKIISYLWVLLLCVFLFLFFPHDNISAPTPSPFARSLSGQRCSAMLWKSGSQIGNSSKSALSLPFPLLPPTQLLFKMADSAPAPAPAPAADADGVVVVVVVKEVAVYLVKPDSVPSFNALSQAMDDFLTTCPGFLRRTVHRDLKNSARFMDVVEWRSLSDAESAAQKVEQGSVPGFLEAMEAVVSLDHFRVYNGE